MSPALKETRIVISCRVRIWKANRTGPGALKVTAFSIPDLAQAVYEMTMHCPSQQVHER